MSDFFQRVSEQVIQRSATGVQPLRTLRFAPLSDTNLPSPLALRQQIAASQPAENPADPAMNGWHLPDPLVPPDSPAASRPIPSFRQMGQAAAASSTILPQATLPSSVADEVEFAENTDDFQAIALQESTLHAEVATPGPLPAREHTADRTPLAFTAPAAEPVTSSANDLARVDAPLPMAPAIAAVDPSSTPAHMAAAPVAQTQESTVDLIRRQPAVGSSETATAEPNRALTAGLNTTPRLNRVQAATATGATDADQPTDAQVASMAYESRLAPSLPAARAATPTAFAAPGTEPIEAEQPSERAAATLPLEKRAIAAEPPVYTPRSDARPATSIQTAAPVPTTPRHTPDQQLAIAVMQAQTVHATRLPEPGIMPSGIEEPSWPAAPLSRPADETFSAQQSDAPADSSVPAQLPSPLASQQPAPIGATPSVGHADAAPGLPVRSVSSMPPAQQTEITLTPAEFEAPTRATASADRQAEPVLAAQQLASQQLASQAVETLSALPDIAQPSSPAAVTPGARADEVPVVPIIRGLSAAQARSPELDATAADVVEPDVTVHQSQLRTVQRQGAESDVALTMAHRPASQMTSQSAVAQPEWRQTEVETALTGEAQVMPVMRSSTSVITPQREPEPPQALLGESGKTTRPVVEQIDMLLPVQPTGEPVTGNGTQVAITAPLAAGHGKEATVMPIVRAVQMPTVQLPTVESTQEPWTPPERVTELPNDQAAAKLPSLQTGVPLIDYAPEIPPAQFAAQPPAITTASSSAARIVEAGVLPVLHKPDSTTVRPAELAPTQEPLVGQPSAIGAAVKEDAGRITDAVRITEPSVLPVVHKQDSATTRSVELESRQEPLSAPGKVSVPVGSQGQAAFIARQSSEATTGSTSLLQTKPLSGSQATTPTIATAAHQAEAKIGPVAQPTLATRATKQALLPLEPISAAMSAPLATTVDAAVLPGPVALPISETAQQKKSRVASVSAPRTEPTHSTPVATVQPTLANQPGKTPGSMGRAEPDLPSAVTQADQVYPAITRIAEVVQPLAAVDQISRSIRPALAPVATPSPATPDTPSSVAGRTERGSGQSSLLLRAENERLISSLAPSTTVLQSTARLLARQHELGLPALDKADPLSDLPPTLAPVHAPVAGIRPREEPYTPSSPAKAQTMTQPLPTIRVTIGRVEVRTTPEAPKPTIVQRQPAQAALSLDAYLKRAKRETR